MSSTRRLPRSEPSRPRSCFTEAQAGTCGSVTSVAEGEFSSTLGGRMIRNMCGPRRAESRAGSRTFEALVENLRMGSAGGCVR